MTIKETQITFGRHLNNDSSSYFGAQVGLGKLNTNQVFELISYLENEDFSNNIFLNDFQEYSELFHFSGIPFAQEFNILEDLNDEDSKSLPNDISFGLDNDECILIKEQNNFLFKEKGFYLISIRFEDYYLIRKAITTTLNNLIITAGIDTLSVLGAIITGDPSFYLLNNFWLNNEIMDFADEEGNGAIFTTYQILYYYDGRVLNFDDAYSRDEMLDIMGADNFIFYSNRNEDAPCIVSASEDICPKLIEEKDVDEVNFSNKINYLKEFLN